MVSTFEGDSPLPLPEAVAVLTANTSSSRWFRFRRPGTTFVGRVWESGFRLTRVVRGRDSFNPMLYGQLRASASGTHARVVMTLHPAVWVFIVLWTLFLGRAFLAEGEFDFTRLTFLVFPWALAACLFPFNARASREALRERLRLREMSRR